MAKKTTNNTLNSELIASLIFGFATVTFITSVAGTINAYLTFSASKFNGQDSYPLFRTIAIQAGAYAASLLIVIFINAARASDQK